MILPIDFTRSAFSFHYNHPGFFFISSFATRFCRTIHTSTIRIALLACLLLPTRFLPFVIPTVRPGRSVVLHCMFFVMVSGLYIVVRHSEKLRIHALRVWTSFPSHVSEAVGCWLNKRVAFPPIVKTCVVTSLYNSISHGTIPNRFVSPSTMLSISLVRPTVIAPLKTTGLSSPPFSPSDHEVLVDSSWIISNDSGSFISI